MQDEQSPLKKGEYHEKGRRCGKGMGKKKRDTKKDGGCICVSRKGNIMRREGDVGGWGRKRGYKEGRDLDLIWNFFLCRFLNFFAALLICCWGGAMQDEQSPSKEREYHEKGGDGEEGRDLYLYLLFFYTSF